MSFDPISYLKAKEAKELADNIVDGEVDKGVLRTNIDQKLNDLEEEYAPKLTQVSSQLAETPTKDDLRLKRDKSALVSANDLDGELLGYLQDGTGGAVINVESVPKDYSVEPIKTTFIVTGKNLFNKEVVLPQKNINISDGSIVASGTNGTHPFIPVREQTNYALSGTAYNSSIIAYYNSEKGFISAERVENNTIVTTPLGTVYVQIAVNEAHVETFQFEEGDKSTPYESFHYIFGDNVTQKPKSIRANHTDFLEMSPNLFNPNEVLNGYINSSSGDFVENDQYYATDFIPVKSNTTYIITQVNNLRLAMYSRGGLGGTISNEDLSTNVFTTTSDTTFIKFHFSSEHDPNAIMLVEGSSLPSNYLPFGKYLINDDIYISNSGNENNDGNSKERTHLSDKTIVCFGDSITGSYSSPTDYPTFLTERLGATAYNVGFSGGRMSNFGSGYDAFSMVGIVDAIVSRDFTPQDENVDINHNWAVKLQTLKSIDFNNVDICTIFYGANDFNSATGTLDNEDDIFDITSTLGATRYAIRKLQTNFPHLKVVLLSTTWRTVGEGFADDTTGRFGHDMIDLVNGLKSVAEFHHIPFINMYNGLGINQHNYETFLLDGLHPNPKGRKLIADRISSQLLANL